MQVTETSTEGLRREFRIVVPAIDIQKRITSRLTEIAGQIKLPGFRPGKVPLGLVKQRYGKSVLGEVLQEAVDETTQKTISDAGLRPALRPKVEIQKFDEATDLEYTVAVEVLPEIEPVDFAKLTLTRLVAQVPEEDVEKALDRIARSRRKFEDAPAKHKAGEGDLVVIDFKGALEGEARDDMRGNGQELEIGSSRFIPGFEDQLKGVKAGDQVKVDLTFPEDYPSAEHRGKPASFEVEVKSVRKGLPVAIDDALATEAGFGSLDDLRAAVRSQTEGEFSRLSRARLKRQLLDALAEMLSFDVPQGMVDLEFETIWKQVQQEIASGDPSNPDVGRPEADLKEEYRAIAVRRVRLGLLFAEVGREQNVQVSQEELNRAIFNEARRYPGQERQVLEFFRKNPQAVEGLRAPLFEDKVVDYILGVARIEERSVTPEELAREPDEGAPGEAEKAAKPKRKAAAKTKKAADEAGSEGSAATEAAAEEPKAKKKAKPKAAAKE